MRLFVVATLLVPALSWLQHASLHDNPAIRTKTSLASSAEAPDYTGKTIYQRTFYRLLGGASLPNPNALVLEERLRFQADPENPGYILPKGLRTYIFRKGTSEDEITDELYRVELGPNNGPGTMDTTIATVLYLAANPGIIQGDVLQLSCESGAAGILGCMAAKMATDPPPPDQPSPKQADDETILTVPHHENVFPSRMRNLILSEEGQENLRMAADVVKDFATSNQIVQLKDLPWGMRGSSRRYQTYYRTIFGSDIDISYPSAKELARVVGNSLLPSNPTVLSSLESRGSSSSSSSSGASSFGGLGMDLGESSTNDSSSSSSSKTDTDPRYPPTFVHVCPDVRENIKYLRQFLEKGYRMTVNSDYLRMERLQFVFQTLPEDADEGDIEDLDLELKDDVTRSYQCLTAVHNFDYTAEGSGEYFFPLESGEYEGGSRSTYLEPEEGGSPW